MTPRIALVLGTLIAAFVVVDVLIYGTQHLIFIGKKLAELIEWISFWR
ncbi:hypothetical protein [Roseobacter sp.]